MGQKGILFQAYMYVPETNPVTECDFHEREDEGHVLRVNKLSNTHNHAIIIYIYTITENGTMFERG